MTQDFSKRISIVINKELPSWQVLNAVSHVAAYFGNQLGDQFGTGETFDTQDGVRFPRNSQYPIIALAAKPEQLAPFAEETRKNPNVKSMCFIREMIETSDDSEIVQILSTKSSSEVEVMAVGVFGENQLIKDLTKPFKLWS